jgi:ADP-ribose pyrophosphatase
MIRLFLSFFFINLHRASCCLAIAAYSLNFGVSSQIESYLEFCSQYPELGKQGNHYLGEIEITFDPIEIENIQSQYHAKFIKEGMSQKEAYDSSRIGILSSDLSWICLRDGVIFPNGTKALANRMIYRTALTGPAGVIIAPMLPDGRVVLIANFRHGTRSWELELPRGKRFLVESIEQTAARECLEETGYRLQKPYLLGHITLDSGMTQTVAPIIVGFTSDLNISHIESFKAIATVITFTKSQLKEGLNKGYIEIMVKDQLVRMVLRDPAIAYVILLAEEKGIW